MKTFTRDGTTISVAAHFIKGPSELSQSLVDTIVLADIDGDREAGFALFRDIAEKLLGDRMEWSISKSDWDKFQG